MFAKGWVPFWAGMSLGEAAGKANESKLFENEAFFIFALILVAVGMISAVIMVVTLILDEVRYRRKK